MIYFKDAVRGKLYKLVKPERTTGYIIPLDPVKEWYASRSRYFISIFPDYIRLQNLGQMTRVERVTNPAKVKKLLFDIIFSSTDSDSLEEFREIANAL